MLRFASTQSCRNNHINNRKLVPRNPIRKFIVVSWFTTFIPLTAFAIDIETPAVGLTDVPLDYVVSGVPAGAVAQLTAGGRSWSATADADGNAAVRRRGDFRGRRRRHYCKRCWRDCQQGPPCDPWLGVGAAGGIGDNYCADAAKRNPGFAVRASGSVRLHCSPLH